MRMKKTVPPLPIPTVSDPTEVVAYAHGRYESVFGSLAPDIIEQRISHIELAHLHSAHGNHSYEDEGFHVRFELGEFCKKPDRQETDQVGQKRISKRVKTFLMVMTQFLNAKALALVISSCKSNKNVFKTGVLNGKVVDENALADEQIQNMGQSFAMIVHKNMTKSL